VQRVALEEGIILLLLDTLGDRLLVTDGEIAGGRFALFFGFGAFQGDDFVHGCKRLKGESKARPRRAATPIFHAAKNHADAARRGQRRFSVNGNITPRRKRETWLVLDETTIAMQLLATLIAAAAACRLPKPLGNA